MESHCKISCCTVAHTRVYTCDDPLPNSINSMYSIKFSYSVFCQCLVCAVGLDKLSQTPVYLNIRSSVLNKGPSVIQRYTPSPPPSNFGKKQCTMCSQQYMKHKLCAKVFPAHAGKRFSHSLHIIIAGLHGQKYLAIFIKLETCL